MQMRFWFALAAALSLSLLESPLQSQRTPPPTTPPRISQPVAREMAGEYRQLIDRFLAGEAESSVTIVKTWQIASVEAVQEHQAWDRVTLRAAAMLETDAALARARDVPRKFGIPVPRGAAPDVTDRMILAIRWLDLADKMRPADKSPFRRQWQVAVGRRLLSDGFNDLAATILGDASLLFRSDPEGRLAYGTVREANAMHVRAYIGEPVGRIGASGFALHDRQLLLDDAATTLGRAVRIAPKLGEARLRQA